MKESKKPEGRAKNRRMEAAVLEFCSDRQAAFAASYLLLIFLISILVFLFRGLDPDKIDVLHKLQPPSPLHWFGTDNMGRDYFARVLYGGQVSLLVGVLAMLCSVLIGVTVGMLSGYFGGLIDGFFMRLVDIFLSIPWLIMVTVFGLLFKKGLLSIILVIGIFSWMDIARIVRSEVLAVKSREYVQYADFIGIPPLSVMTGHILPAVFSTIITASTSTIAGAIMTESALSFLGLGVQQPMSSWGSLLQQSQKYLQNAPYMALLPGILIILTVYSFNKLGDILRVFAEPRVRAGEEDMPRDGRGKSGNEETAREKSGEEKAENPPREDKERKEAEIPAQEASKRKEAEIPVREASERKETKISAREASEKRGKDE